MVSRTPLLTFDAYRNPKDRQLRDYALRFREITKDEFLGNLKQQIEVAARLPHFMRGKDVYETTAFQKQVIVDLYNAMGWNPGYRKVSNWRTDVGWWVEPDDPSSESDNPFVDSNDDFHGNAAPEPIVEELAPDVSPPPPARVDPKDHLSISTYSHIKMYKLFDKIKLALHALPCHNDKCEADTAFYTKDGGKKVFRLKCKHCHKKLSRGAAQTRFIDLIERGDLVVNLARF